MEKKTKIKIILLFILGLVLTIGAVYVPDACYALINLFEDNYQEIRYQQLIPSIRTGGILLSAWGMILLLKYKK